jgi:hypothetical protein
MMYVLILPVLCMCLNISRSMMTAPHTTGTPKLPHAASTPPDDVSGLSGKLKAQPLEM